MGFCFSLFLPLSLTSLVSSSHRSATIIFKKCFWRLDQFLSQDGALKWQTDSVMNLPRRSCTVETWVLCKQDEPCYTFVNIFGGDVDSRCKLKWGIMLWLFEMWAPWISCSAATHNLASHPGKSQLSQKGAVYISPTERSCCITPAIFTCTKSQVGLTPIQYEG